MLVNPPRPRTPESQCQSKGRGTGDTPPSLPIIPALLSFSSAVQEFFELPLETTRVRQRVANEIWSNYHDYICARIKFADPTPDKQRTNEDEAVSDAAKQAEQAQRYTIQAYLHRTRQPLELGV